MRMQILGSCAVIIAMFQTMSTFAQTETDDATQPQQIGFEAADNDADGKLSQTEFEVYLDNRIGGLGVPYADVFKRLDANEDSHLSTKEFDNRHAAIEHFMGEDFFNQNGGFPADPGKGFQLFSNETGTINDAKVMSAVFYRYQDLLNAHPGNWNVGNSEDIPETVPTQIRETLQSVEKTDKFDYARAVKATGVIVGGEQAFFSAGAVLISPNGLAITNYHVARAMLEEGRMALVTSDGVAHKVIEFVAGHQVRDVAIIRIEGDNFDFVPLANELPSIGGDLSMLHHSENRFYTFDRGYLMRYPIVDGEPFMEVSMDFAPGGSGCGIYNAKGHLVGLVSTILQSEGPSMTHQVGTAPSDAPSDIEPLQEEGAESMGDMSGMDNAGTQLGLEPFLLIKHAVSPQSILGLLGQDTKDEP